MASEKLRNVRKMIFMEGRPMDAALWNVYFEDAPQTDALKILQAYQTREGDFRGLYDNASNDEAIRLLASLKFPKDAEGLMKKLKQFLGKKMYLTNLEAAFLSGHGGDEENYLLGEKYSEEALLSAFQKGKITHAFMGLGEIEKLDPGYRAVLKKEADALEESCRMDGTWPGNIYRARRSVLNMLYITKVRSDELEDV